MLKLKQHGFGSIELILILIIVLLLGVVGWFVYDRNQNKHSPNKATSSTTQTKTNISDTSTSFDTSKITNFSKVPTGAQSLLVTDAESLFSKCTDDPRVKPDAKVVIAQSNFVAIGLGCDGGGLHYYGLNDNKWTKLGSGATGLDCAQVTKYKITQASLIDYAPPTCTNFSSDGGSSTIPQ